VTNSPRAHDDIECMMRMWGHRLHSMQQHLHAFVREFECIEIMYQEDMSRLCRLSHRERTAPYDSTSLAPHILDPPQPGPDSFGDSLHHGGHYTAPHTRGSLGMPRQHPSPYGVPSQTDPTFIYHAHPESVYDTQQSPMDLTFNQHENPESVYGTQNSLPQAPPLPTDPTFIKHENPQSVYGVQHPQNIYGLQSPDTGYAMPHLPTALPVQQQAAFAQYPHSQRFRHGDTPIIGDGFFA